MHQEDDNIVCTMEDLILIFTIFKLYFITWLNKYQILHSTYTVSYTHLDVYKRQEQKINEAYDTILRADKVTAEMIPACLLYTST